MNTVKKKHSAVDRRSTTTNDTMLMPSSMTVNNNLPDGYNFNSFHIPSSRAETDTSMIGETDFKYDYNRAPKAPQFGSIKVPEDVMPRMPLFSLPVAVPTPTNMNGNLSTLVGNANSLHSNSSATGLTSVTVTDQELEQEHDSSNNNSLAAEFENDIIDDEEIEGLLVNNANAVGGRGPRNNINAMSMSKKVNGVHNRTRLLSQEEGHDLLKEKAWRKQAGLKERYYNFNDENLVSKTINGDGGYLYRTMDSSNNNQPGVIHVRGSSDFYGTNALNNASVCLSLLNDHLSKSAMNTPLMNFDAYRLNCITEESPTLGTTNSSMPRIESMSLGTNAIDNKFDQNLVKESSEVEIKISGTSGDDNDSNRTNQRSTESDIAEFSMEY